MAKKRAMPGSSARKKTASKAKKKAKTQAKPKRKTIKSALLGKMETVPLGEVATIIKGTIVASENSPKAVRVKIATPSDLPLSGFVQGASKGVKLKEGLINLRKYFLQPYDVLFPAVGNFSKIGIMPEKVSGKWMPNQTLFILRFDENKKDYAIAVLMFLKSDVGQKIIKGLETGKKLKIIAKSIFSVLEIPVFSPENIKLAKAEFAKECRMYDKIVAAKADIAEIRKLYLSGSKKKK